MAGNSFGDVFRITTYGESHGPGIGVVIDGCPAGLEIDEDSIKTELERRKPGQNSLVSSRQESEAFEIQSGVFEGKTIGSPLAIYIFNQDAKSDDYDFLRNLFRPSHADYTYQAKYGVRDHRGGGRSSARATAAVVAAGAVARQLLLKACKQANMPAIDIRAYVSQIGPVKVTASYKELHLNQIEKSPIRCPDEKVEEEMINTIEMAKKMGDSVGGVITCVIRNCPAGLGEPLFDKMQADLAKAMFSINAVHGFEYGSGFAGSALFGSQNNDEFAEVEGNIITKTNHSGGIQGGITNGMDIYFNVAFKPTATISKAQDTVNNQGEETTVEGTGRHDPTVLPRAVPIVEAMTALVITDHYLRNRNAKL